MSLKELETVRSGVEENSTLPLRRKYKVIFLIRSLHIGGTERGLVTLARSLDKEVFVVTVLTFYSGGAFEEDLKLEGIKIINLKKSGRWDLFGFFWRLLRYLRTDRPDIIHSYLTEPNIATILLKPFLRPTKIVWGIQSSNMELRHYDWFTRLTPKIQRLLSPFADLLIANSHAGRTYHLGQGFPGHKMVVIHSGFNTARFKPDVESGRRIRDEWGVRESTFLVGIVGRLDPMKDHPTFLKAASLLCQRRDDVLFACVGSGPEDYARRLYELAASLGLTRKIIWAGLRADMMAVYNAFNLVTSSSFGEGLPCAIGEAMACAKTCVVTDAGDSALLVGETGLVVKPQDPQALATGWERCLKEDTAEMGRKARQRILEHFNVDQFAGKIERAILSIV